MRQARVPVTVLYSARARVLFVSVQKERARALSIVRCQTETGDERNKGEGYRKGVSTRLTGFQKVLRGAQGTASRGGRAPWHFSNMQCHVQSAGPPLCDSRLGIFRRRGCWNGIVVQPAQYVPTL